MRFDGSLQSAQGMESAISLAVKFNKMGQNRQDRPSGSQSRVHQRDEMGRRRGLSRFSTEDGET